MEKRQLVFISHANPEDNEFASWLGARLAAAGYEVWADVLNLLGGEKFWRNIGNTIKRETAVFIVALSRASYQKDGVLDEIALAVNAGRKINKQQFIIPIRLDDLPYTEFPEQLIRLNAIDFSTNWADGLSRLLTTLKDTQVPQSTTDTGDDLAAWQMYRLRQGALVSNTPEMLYSNWLSIRSLPSHIHFSRFNALQEAVMRAFHEFQSPVVQHLRLASSFADVTSLQKETPNIPLERAYCVPLADFLRGRSSDGPDLSWLDARNMVIGLVRKGWDQFAGSRGLLPYEFAHGSAWFVPLDLIEGNSFAFEDEAGKTRRRRLVGKSEKRGVYWHFAVSEKVSLGDPMHLALRTHVVFTDNGRTPLDSDARAHRLRRSFCKNWWNERWRDLLRAFVAFMANGSEEFYVSLGGDADVTIAASPITFEAPLSIANDPPILTAEDESAEGETEVDALLDPFSDQHEAESEDQFGNEEGP